MSFLVVYLRVPLHVTCSVGSLNVCGDQTTDFLVVRSVFWGTQTGPPAGMIPMRSMHGFSSASGRFWSTLLSFWVLATNPCRISLNIPSPPTQTTLQTYNKSTQVSLLRIIPSLKKKKERKKALLGWTGYTLRGARCVLQFPWSSYSHLKRHHKNWTYNYSACGKCIVKYLRGKAKLLVPNRFRIYPRGNLKWLTWQIGWCCYTVALHHTLVVSKVRALTPYWPFANAWGVQVIRKCL